MKLVRFALICHFLVLCALRPLSAQSISHQDYVLPSGMPSRIAVNDKIYFRYYPVEPAQTAQVPAVVLLHPLGDSDNLMTRHFAVYLHERGIASVIMELPYHMRRLPPHDSPLRHYGAASPEMAVQAFQQANADIHEVVDWLSAQPSIDSRRIGVVGISLGAILAHLAMGTDDRLKTGVAIVGGGNLKDIFKYSILFRIFNFGRPHRLSARQVELTKLVDPITYADRNRPRHVLMIQSARDELVPPSNATQLWNALGHPPIRWLDTNHYGPILSYGPIMRDSADYLLRSWSDPNYDGSDLKPIPSPTVKIGFMTGLDSGFSPAVTWQAVTLFTRPDHMSFLSLNTGWCDRGPFVGAAVTINSYLDLGIGRRLGGSSFRPYLSLHVVL